MSAPAGAANGRNDRTDGQACRIFAAQVFDRVFGRVSGRKCLPGAATAFANTFAHPFMYPFMHQLARVVADRSSQIALHNAKSCQAGPGRPQGGHKIRRRCARMAEASAMPEPHAACALPMPFAQAGHGRVGAGAVAGAGTIGSSASICFLRSGPPFVVRDASSHNRLPKACSTCCACRACSGLARHAP